MENKGNYKERSFKNDLHSNSEFDLDAYLEEQSNPENFSLGVNQEPEKHHGSGIKNAIVMTGLIIVSVLWYFDWSPQQTWAGIFGSNENNVVAGQTGTAPDIQINIPRIEIPPMPMPMPDLAPFTIPSNTGNSAAPALDMNMTEYLSALKEKGFLEDEISTFSARQLYDAGVPIHYLEELNEAGFLSDLSFVHITNFYQNSIPTSYLIQLSETDFYDKLSFVDITNYYQSNVPIDYLKQMDDAGYLVDLSFVHITNYYQAGVTPEFLDELKVSGLYDDLNFLDVVDLYQREHSN